MPTAATNSFRVDAASAELAFDPAVHFCFEQNEWQGAVFEQFIMKGPDIESCAEGLFRPRSDLNDLQLADFVAERLPRQRDITINLETGATFAAAGGFDDKFDGLRAAPAFAMQPDIDDQPHGAKEF